MVAVLQCWGFHFPTAALAVAFTSLMLKSCCDLSGGAGRSDINPQWWTRMMGALVLRNSRAGYADRNMLDREAMEILDAVTDGLVR